MYLGVAKGTGPKAELFSKAKVLDFLREKVIKW